VGMEDETMAGGAGYAIGCNADGWEGEVGGVIFNGGESRRGDKSGIAGEGGAGPWPEAAAGVGELSRRGVCGPILVR
jgi:hypothetical protein